MFRLGTIISIDNAGIHIYLVELTDIYSESDRFHIGEQGIIPEGITYRSIFVDLYTQILVCFHRFIEKHLHIGGIQVYFIDHPVYHGAALGVYQVTQFIIFLTVYGGFVLVESIGFQELRWEKKRRHLPLNYPSLHHKGL